MTSRVSICTALLAAPLFAGLLAGAAVADQHASTKICNPVQQGDGTAVIQSTAAEPSLTCEDVPAVWSMPGITSLSSARPSALVGRMP